MTATLLRRDFVDTDAACGKPGCPRKLRSGTAWIVGFDDGGEHPYGPVCVRNLLGDAEFAAQAAQVADLTTRYVAEEQDEERHQRPGAGGHGGGARADEDAARHRLACTYLIVRMQRLAQLPGIHVELAGFAPVAELYGRYRRNRRLDRDEVALALRIEQRASEAHYRMSLVNLLDVYTTYRRLQQLRANAKGNNRKWLDGLSAHLLRNLWLTPKQLQTATGLRPHQDAFPERHALAARARQGDAEHPGRAADGHDNGA